MSSWLSPTKHMCISDAYRVVLHVIDDATCGCSGRACLEAGCKEQASTAIHIGKSRQVVDITCRA